MQGRYEYYCSVYEPINNTVKFDHCLTRSNINVRAVCPGSTRDPFHTFNQRRSMHGSYWHCSITIGKQKQNDAWGWKYIMWPRNRQVGPTALNTKQLTTLSNSIAHMQQYKRTICLSRANTTPISYNEPKKISARPLLTLLSCIRTVK